MSEYFIFIIRMMILFAANVKMTKIDALYVSYEAKIQKLTIFGGLFKQGLQIQGENSIVAPFN